MTIRPDGKLYVQSGVGNLGTHSVIDLARVAADMLAMPWEKVEVVWGNTSKGLPWTLPVGRQPDDARDDARESRRRDGREAQAAGDCRAAISAARPTTTSWAASACSARAARRAGCTYAQAATRAIALGGRFDGHELPDDIHAVTKAAATQLAGLGLMGVAKDTYPRDGDTYSFVAGFAEVEVDVETGAVTLVDFLGVGDVGIGRQPAQPRRADRTAACCLGIAHALHQKTRLRPALRAVAGARASTTTGRRRSSTCRTRCTRSALDIPDPETPVGAKGVGEPPVGAGYGAVLNAIADAIGVDAFRRAPVTSDVVLMSLTHGRRMHEPLQAHL